MKILDNGVIRDMTPEEEYEFIHHSDVDIMPPPDPAETANKAEAYDILMGVSE